MSAINNTAVQLYTSSCSRKAKYKRSECNFYLTPRYFLGAAAVTGHIMSLASLGETVLGIVLVLLGILAVAAFIFACE